MGVRKDENDWVKCMDFEVEGVRPIAFSALTLLVWRQEGHPACKENGGDDGSGCWLVRMEWHPAVWSACLHHKVQKFSSGTGSPGWSRKKRLKTVVVWWWCGLLVFCD